MADKTIKATEIKTIEIEIAGSKISLSPSQAKELRDILVDLLGTKSTALDEIKKRLSELEQEKPYWPITIPVPYLQPYPVPYLQPHPVPYEPWRPYWTTTWCSSGCSSGDMNTGTIQLSCRSE